MKSAILVDEEPVAAHGDGWTPIEVDLTEALAGRTSFELGVDARVPDDRNGGRFSQSLAAKQDWYGVQGRDLEVRAIGSARPASTSPESRCEHPSISRRGVVSVKGEQSRAAAATALQITLAARRRSGRAPDSSFPIGAI